ncbi:ATP-binding protein [Paenibacillus sacheonensis]|uniref:GAF domain-containing sensor histidine kinase n=1 Tax=Paenibacillus sacheonensis TaxID=742054 RepID=UPI00308419FA|nr:signal transduction histidine kinase [Paenibacillus sacheonensis]
MSIVSSKLYESAAKVMESASRMMPANTFCIANLDSQSTKVIKTFNRSGVILEEGLVINNEESYCALVTEHARGPLIIEDNLTHPLTRDMDATQFVGGCSFLGVPVFKANGEVYGSLCAFDQGYYRYEEKDVQLLLSLSALFTSFLEVEVAFQRLKEAEEINLRMLEEKSNLLTMLNHEVRSPMDGVLSMVSLLNTTERTEEQIVYIDLIEKSGNNLLAIMDHIDHYVQIEAGAELETSPFDIREAVAHVINMHADEAADKGIRLHAQFEISDQLILIGDSAKLHLILSHLVRNAIKCTESGEVAVCIKLISTRDDMVDIAFEVRDTGVGIPALHRKRLFRTFSQVHQDAHAGKYGGVGLGLTICKRLAELMEGTIWLEQSSDEGSLFIFRVALKRLVLQA